MAMVNPHTPLENNPKFGCRSGREMLVLLASGMLLGMLGSTTVVLLGFPNALVASAALMAVASGAGCWWQFRGRERLPPKKPPRISLAVRSSSQ